MSTFTEPQRRRSSFLEAAQPRLLVADDDPPMRHLLAGELRRAGYQVVECGDGASLVKRLASVFLRDARPDPFDLVISDVRMPGLSGLEILEALQDRAGLPPMILITAFGDRETHLRAERLGAVAMIDKPFRIPDFVALVDRTVREERPGPGHRGAWLGGGADHPVG